MRKQQTKQIIFAGTSLCLLLALQAFMICEPGSIVHALLSDGHARTLTTTCCWLAFALTFFAIAACAYFRQSWLTRPPLVATVASLLIGFLLLYAASLSERTTALLLASSLFLGIGQALGFICCTRIFASFELSVAKALLIISSVPPIIPYFFAVAFNGEEASVALVVICILFPLSMVALLLSLKVVPIKPLNTVPDKARKARYGAVLKTLLPSVALAFLLGLPGPAVGSAALAAQTSELVRGLIFQAGNTCAALTALLLWFGFKVRITVPYVYFFSFPAIAMMLFAIPFVGVAYWPALLLISNLVFCLVSIAVMVTCLETARLEHVNILVIYGVFAGCMYLSRVVGLGIGTFAEQFGDLSVSFVALALLLAFSLAVYFMPRKRWRRTKANRASKSSGSKAEEDVTLHTSDAIQARCKELQEQFGISKRELEVLMLILHGRNVPAISQALSISENTVRTHVKRLYGTFNVHSRQELIAFVDRTET